MYVYFVGKLNCGSSKKLPLHVSVYYYTKVVGIVVSL
jgi:hypothetical protein